MWPVSLSVVPAALEARWASQSSCQQSRGWGGVTPPEGEVVMYVFSEGCGCRGRGAMRWRVR